MTPGSSNPLQPDEEWSIYKEIVASLRFEYAAPHNRHKSIEGEAKRLMGLIDSHYKTEKAEAVLEARIDELTNWARFFDDSSMNAMTPSERLRKRIDQLTKPAPTDRELP